jgi:hypothetical protein
LLSPISLVLCNKQSFMSCLEYSRTYLVLLDCCVLHDSSNLDSLFYCYGYDWSSTSRSVPTCNICILHLLSF